MIHSGSVRSQMFEVASPTAAETWVVYALRSKFFPTPGVLGGAGLLVLSTSERATFPCSLICRLSTDVWACCATSLCFASDIADGVILPIAMAIQPPCVHCVSFQLVTAMCDSSCKIQRASGLAGVVSER